MPTWSRASDTEADSSVTPSVPTRPRLTPRGSLETTALCAASQARGPGGAAHGLRRSFRGLGHHQDQDFFSLAVWSAVRKQNRSVQRAAVAVCRAQNH